MAILGIRKEQKRPEGQFLITNASTAHPCPRRRSYMCARGCGRGPVRGDARVGVGVCHAHAWEWGGVLDVEPKLVRLWWVCSFACGEAGFPLISLFPGMAACSTVLCGMAACSTVLCYVAA
jgi:phage shock protein PspC (stress-responsive transcriptional regulator)